MQTYLQVLIVPATAKFSKYRVILLKNLRMSYNYLIIKKRNIWDSITFYSVSDIDVFITYLTVKAKAANPIKTIKFIKQDWKLLASPTLCWKFWLSGVAVLFALRLVNSAWNYELKYFLFITNCIHLPVCWSPSLEINHRIVYLLS